MTAVLSEVGKRLTDRWATLLLVPGLLYVCAVVTAGRLGYAHALDWSALQAWINVQSKSREAGSAGAIILILAAVLAIAAAAGALAAVLGRVIGKFWSVPGDRRVLRLATMRRRRRWDAANERVTRVVAADQPSAAAELRQAFHAQNRISLVRPAYPTWIGDRLHGTDARIHDFYGLDLGTVWPRLWLITPDSVRSELSAAQEKYVSASRAFGWSLLYAGLIPRWWPALPISAVIFAAAWIRSREAVQVLADLTEATVDLYADELANQLGIPQPNGFTKAVGFDVTARVRKDDLALGATKQPSLLSRLDRGANGPLDQAPT